MSGAYREPALPSVNSVVCIRNREARRSLALETCHIGRVIETFKVDSSWHCNVSVYLRPDRIPTHCDPGSNKLDSFKDIITDCRPCVSVFEVDDIFSKCKILSGDSSRSPESILKHYSGHRPCFVLRFQLVETETGKFTIEPLFPLEKKMVCDKSEVLSENCSNMKFKEGVTSEGNRIKSPRQHTQFNVHSHDELKENITANVSSFTQMKPEPCVNLIPLEETSGTAAKHGKLSRTTVRRSLVSDLDFSPVKQSRLDGEVEAHTKSVVDIEQIEIKEGSSSIPKDSWVSALLDANDTIVQNGGPCLTPIRLSLKRIRLDTTPSKEHPKNNSNTVSEWKKLPQSAKKKERKVSSAESDNESDSDVSYSTGTSSISSTLKPTRRSARKSQCKVSLAEAATDSESEELDKRISNSSRKRVEKATSIPGITRTPKRQAISSDECNLDGNKPTRRLSMRQKEAASTCTPSSSNRRSRLQLRSSSSKKSYSDNGLDDPAALVDSRTPSKKGSRRDQSLEESEDLMMSPDESRTPLAHRTPNKTPRGSRKTPLKTLSKTPSKSPRTPKTKTACRTPSRSALTPSMPVRASAPLTPISNLEQVRKNLHVSAVPMSLPCRQSEYRNIYNFLENKIRDASGGCMYISGVPGTGKTATVHAVIRSLKDQVGTKKLRDFQYIETNGLRMTEPRQVFVQVLKALTGEKCTPQQAQDILAERFCLGSSKNKTVVLLVDEVDMLRNRRQDVIYNLFDWPSKPNSRFIVLTIANTMDLPERLLKGRVTSRLGLTRLTFQPYSYKQLQEIVMSRLQGSNSFNDDAVELVARKVAACSGDVRRALDICRRASEVVEEGNPVTMPIINKVLSQMMNSANVCSIKACSRLEKLFLQAVVAENERTGVEETIFISVYRQFQSLCALSNVFPINISEAMAVLNRLGTSGLLLTEHSRADINQSIFLNVNADDIHYALNQATPVS